ncbi:hypothetical protein DPMN_105181 [Dreissena polymorpha]|uniref:Uncharacterized protein n=1 Tax=Dreissena polymorpha TaxID=45954 RepID=A0A9D4H926_DREPO|nr:hypothetical protein DPMN_105181 [Dreissena polymorpha]
MKGIISKGTSAPRAPLIENVAEVSSGRCANHLVSLPSINVTTCRRLRSDTEICRVRLKGKESI